MKSLLLSTILFATWMVWSGHAEPFMVCLGVASCLFTVYLTRRMGILDSESVPSQLGFRPFSRYAPWLLKEVLIANIKVARRIVSPSLRICPTMVMIPASQRSAIGRVIMANSVTLTPGTVSIDLQADTVSVHALTKEFAAEDASSEMNRRVCQLENPQSVDPQSVDPQSVDAQSVDPQRTKGDN